VAIFTPPRDGRTFTRRLLWIFNETLSLIPFSPPIAPRLFMARLIIEHKKMLFLFTVSPPLGAPDNNYYQNIGCTLDLWWQQYLWYKLMRMIII
jgi:hypothetical protein